MDLLFLIPDLFRDKKPLIPKRLHNGAVSILLFELVFKALAVQVHAEPVRSQPPAVFPFAEADGLSVRNVHEKINLDGFHPVCDFQIFSFSDFIAKVGLMLLSNINVHHMF